VREFKDNDIIIVKEARRFNMELKFLEPTEKLMKVLEERNITLLKCHLGYFLGYDLLEK